MDADQEHSYKIQIDTGDVSRIPFAEMYGGMAIDINPLTKPYIGATILQMLS
jgi:hypothetical protein